MSINLLILIVLISYLSRYIDRIKLRVQGLIFVLLYTSYYCFTVELTICNRKYYSNILFYCISLLLNTFLGFCFYASCSLENLNETSVAIFCLLIPTLFLLFHLTNVLSFSFALTMPQRIRGIIVFFFSKMIFFYKINYDTMLILDKDRDRHDLLEETGNENELNGQNINCMERKCAVISGMIRPRHMLRIRDVKNQVRKK